MAYKVIMTTIVSVAIIIAMLSLIPNRYALEVVVYISRLFGLMIPVLAVGGLLKWIFFWGKCGKD